MAIYGKRVAALLGTVLIGFVVGWMHRPFTPEKVERATVVVQEPKRIAWVDQWLQRERAAEVAGTAGKGPAFLVMPKAPDLAYADKDEGRAMLELAHRDPAAAMEKLTKLGANGASLIKDMMRLLVKTDPSQSVALLFSYGHLTSQDSFGDRPSGPFGGAWFQHVPTSKFPELATGLKWLPLSGDGIRDVQLEGFLGTWARNDLDAATTWVSENLPPDDQAYKIVQARLALELIQRSSDLSHFEPLAQLLPELDPKSQSKVLQSLARSIAQYDDVASRATALIDAAPAEARVQVVRDIGQSWGVNSAPEDAAAWAMTLDSGELRAAALDRLAYDWSVSAPEELTAWLEQRPPVEQAEFLSILDESASKRDAAKR